MTFDEGLRLDVLIEELIICKLKAVDQMNSVREAQIIGHLKRPLIKDGIKRIIL
jgi:hypothetical protein